MNGPGWRPILLLALGALVLLGILVRASLRRFDVPALVGFLALGVGYSAADHAFLHLPPESRHALETLADLGIVCLLFRVGLESDLRALWRELPRASLVLLVNVAASAALGYATARWCGVPVVASLFVAVALSATSIAVAATVWEGAGLLRTRAGALVLDVAELDDLLGVVLMVLLFAAVPALDRGSVDLANVLLPAVLAVLVKSLVFGGGCWAFARFIEPHVTRRMRRLRDAPDPILTLVGIAMVVAGLAAGLGFSLAVGALFAGLVFSGDPRVVRMQASFTPVHDLLAPFFFIGVGASLDLAALPEALALGLPLLVAAVLGKFLGSALPLWKLAGGRTAVVVGVSLVPRAEIALFVVDQGRSTLGNDRMPAAVSGAMVLIVAATCVGVPPLLRRMLRPPCSAAPPYGAWPQ